MKEVICIDSHSCNLILGNLYLTKLYSPNTKLCMIYDLDNRPMGTFQSKRFKTINEFRNNRINYINGYKKN